MVVINTGGMRFFLIFILLISFIPLSYQETPSLDDKTMSGSSHGSDIELIFSGNVVSGTLTSDTYAINLDDVKVIERKDRLLIFDKQNDLKILSKQISPDKYLVIAKINSDDVQTKLRFVADIGDSSTNKNISQRNLFDAVKQKQAEEEKEKLDSMTPKDLQALEKQKAVDEALKKFEEKMKKLAQKEKKEPHGEKTSQSILDKWKKSQTKTGMDLVVVEEEKTKEDKKSKKETKPDVSKSHPKIKVFVSVPHHQEWKKVLRYSMLVTDDSGHRYNSDYKSYVGNELSDVKISGTIKDPAGKKIQSFNGTTADNGEYLGQFLIPDQSTTRGEYAISVDAVKTFKDDTVEKSSNSGIFFVFPSKNDGPSNHAPIADAGPDLSYPEHDGVIPTFTEITLDGSGSSDPDGDTITYSWVQTSGTAISLSDTTAQQPTFIAPNIASTDDLIFELIVTDTKGLTSSTSEVTITITFVD